MAYKIIRPRHGIKSLWNTYKSRIYKLGEMLVESPESGVGSGQVNIKFGDGVTDYENLPYAVEAPISQLIEGSTKPMTSGAGYEIQRKVEEVNGRFHSLQTVSVRGLDGRIGTNQIFYLKTGSLVTVYFSIKTSGIVKAGEVFYLENLPQTALEQSMRFLTAFGRGEAEVVVNGTTASMSLLIDAPSGYWVRGMFNYIAGN